MADFNSGLIGSGAAIGTSIEPGYGTVIGAAAGAVLAGGEYLWNSQSGDQQQAARPTYQIPTEVTQGLTLAEQQALQGLPEAQKQQYIQNLQRGATYGLAQQQTRQGGLSGIAALNENLNQGYANLLSQDSAARYQRQQNVYSQLQNVADYQGQEFQLNQLNPYYEKYAQQNANRGALYQNLGNAAQLGLYGYGQKKEDNLTELPEQNMSMNPTVNSQQTSNPFPQGNMLGYNGLSNSQTPPSQI